MLMFVLMVGILDVWLGVSFRGNAVLTAVSATLLIIAYQMIGCLMQLLARNMAVGLSLTGIIVSPAFGYAGVGFPVLAMQDFPRAWGAILPLRWYIQILFDQATRGAALHYTAEPFAILCGITVVLALLVWLRFPLAGPARPASSRGRRAVTRAGDARGRGGVRGGMAADPCRSRRVLAVRPGTGALRGLLPAALSGPDRPRYPDRGRGPGPQRTRPRADPGLEAHGNISVALRASSYHEAEDAILARRAFAILGIPPDTEKNVLKGVTARLPVYADSTYFILFNRSLQGMLESVQAYATDALTHGARAEGAGVQAASRLNEPVDLVQVPLFNPTASYSSYVVPAAFVLILHQTLLMGAAMLGGAIYERGGRAARRTRASATAILGQGLAHWTLYVPAMLLYFVVMPRIYGFSTLGSVWALAALSIPFILATSFLGQALGLVFRHRETAVLLVLASSLPQFFLVGVSWPVEALPGLLRQLRELLPSVNAIDGMVRINQMGASLARGSARLDAPVGAHAALFRRRHCVGALARRRGPSHAASV